MWTRPISNTFGGTNATQKNYAGGGGAFDAYASWLRAGGLSEGTVRLRLHHLEKFAARHDVLTVTTGDIVAWLDRPDWKPATQLAVRSSLRSFYKWATESGLRPDDPSAKTRAVKVPPRAIKEAPQAALLQALERVNDRDRLAVMLAAYAGLRRAEIATLHADNIGDRMLTVTGKGSKTRRVPIHPMLEAPLREAKARGGYLFRGCDGWSPVTPDAMGRRISRALPDKWSAHSLRHYYAGHVYRASHDIRAVQMLLGHSSIATTEIYTRIDDDDLHAAVGAWAV
jgi:integrase/recombinase XerC